MLFAFTKKYTFTKVLSFKAGNSHGQTPLLHEDAVFIVFFIFYFAALIIIDYEALIFAIF
jgi:hypothetical protein